MPDAQRLAAIHAAAFTHPRPWSATEIGALLQGRGVFVIEEPDGFVMGRVVLDEVELLTLAVRPAARRQGVGARLLAGFGVQSQARGATRALLEVAGDNPGAQALYAGAGWRVSGRRRGYYRDAAGQPVDALLMECTFARPMG